MHWKQLSYPSGSFARRGSEFKPLLRHYFRGKRKRKRSKIYSATVQLQCETNAYGEANYARYVPILRHKTSSNVLVSQKTKLTSDNTLVFLRGLQK